MMVLFFLFMAMVSAAFMMAVITMFKEGMWVKHHSVNKKNEGVASKDQDEGKREGLLLLSSWMPQKVMGSLLGVLNLTVLY